MLKKMIVALMFVFVYASVVLGQPWPPAVTAAKNDADGANGARGQAYTNMEFPKSLCNTNRNYCLEKKNLCTQTPESCQWWQNAMIYWLAGEQDYNAAAAYDSQGYCYTISGNEYYQDAMDYTELETPNWSAAITAFEAATEAYNNAKNCYDNPSSSDDATGMYSNANPYYGSSVSYWWRWAGYPYAYKELDWHHNIHHSCPCY